MGLEIKEISFEEITPYWKMLWGEDVTIRRKSGILLLKGFDIMLNDNEDIVPTFFGAFDGDNIIGVNSGYPIDNQYRSRGLYVLPEYRRQGVAQMLLYATQEQGRKEKKKILWSMPRKEALPAYLKFGFRKVSGFSDREFGQNCFVVKTI